MAYSAARRLTPPYEGHTTMSDEGDYEYFKLRKESKTYISKVFTYGAHTEERLRNVKIVFEGSDELRLGEVEGAMCLRLSGETRKTQVSAIITQDDKQVRRLTLQTFKPRAGGWIEAIDKDEFTFRGDEFLRLQRFLAQLKFIDLSNEDTFPIEDISTGHGPKAIIDAADRGLIARIRALSHEQRTQMLNTLQGELTTEEVNILLGRRQGLGEYERHLADADWSEGDWQDFFEREQWVFGYGLDYRVMRHFDREMTVGRGGTDNQNKPVIDFLETFTDYTVLVEIKRPDTDIFRASRGGRAGTWEFTPEFIGGVSQVLEQKAEWASFAETAEHHNRAGTASLAARTRNAKAILVIGSREEFARGGNDRETNIKRDTFELFRRETRGIDIVTFDELLERARFITRNH